MIRDMGPYYLSSNATHDSVERTRGFRPVFLWAEYSRTDVYLLENT